MGKNHGGLERAGKVKNLTKMQTQAKKAEEQTRATKTTTNSTGQALTSSAVKK